ncbi:DUF2141 domain-containing protein [Corallincola platygyrae]|uniref:DUF2141 domain-containing protein n=1 Tax=Corallincola platygyrae TaxID=1193278 RepID=A0ABW4XI57_9GAMM
MTSGLRYMSAIALLCIPHGLWAEQTLSISGEIFFKDEGTIYLALVDKIHFNTPSKSHYSIILNPTESHANSGTIAFSFEGIVKGSYAIKAFQDRNGNGELDVGMFGPKEPWAIYKPADASWGAPKFEDTQFELTDNLSNIELVLD